MRFEELEELVRTDFNADARGKCQSCVRDILSGVIRRIPDILGTNPEICPEESRMESLVHEGIDGGHDYGKETHFLAHVPFSSAVGHLLARGWIRHDALLDVLRDNGYGGSCLSEILRNPAALDFCRGLHAVEDVGDSESGDCLAGRRLGPFPMPYLLAVLMIANPTLRWKPIRVKMNFLKNPHTGHPHTDGREWRWYRCDVPTSSRDTTEDVAEKMAHAMGFAEHAQNLLMACLARREEFPLSQEAARPEP